MRRYQKLKARDGSDATIYQKDRLTYKVQSLF
jgi:hypothetical protein